jgi:hypothetical protein
MKLHRNAVRRTGSPGFRPRRPIPPELLAVASFSLLLACAPEECQEPPLVPGAVPIDYQAVTQPCERRLRPPDDDTAFDIAEREDLFLFVDLESCSNEELESSRLYRSWADPQRTARMVGFTETHGGCLHRGWLEGVYRGFNRDVVIHFINEDLRRLNPGPDDCPLSIAKTAGILLLTTSGEGLPRILKTEATPDVCEPTELPIVEFADGGS